MSLRGITILVLVAAIIMVVPSANAAEQKKPPAATPPGQKDASPSRELTPAKPTAPRPTITVKDGRLTAQVENLPLDWILEEISRRGQVAISTAPGVGHPPVSVQLRDVPVDDALRQILIDHDAFFFYGGDKKSRALLRAVWIYPKGGGRGFAPVPPDAWASTKEISEEARTNPDPAARARAVETLVERKHDQALDVVLHSLRDRDDQVRTRALYGAQTAGVDIPVDTLVALALSDPSPDVRFLALDGLASNPGAALAVDLRSIATHAVNDPSPHVQIKAEEILTRLDGFAAPPAAQQPLQAQPRRRGGR